MPSVLFENRQRLATRWSLVGQMNQVIQSARDKLDSQYHERMGFVTDLDDTAFVSAFRTSALFKRFAHSTEWTGQADPEDMIRQVDRLARAGQMPYLAKDLLREFPEGLVSTWYEFWRMHFFSNPALDEDLPQEQIKMLLQLIRRKGVPIGYLTGRHLPTQTGAFPAGMVQGTISNLWRHDFPHGPVVFKPSFSLSDSVFKRAVFSTCLEPGANGLIPSGYVDNEPGIVNLHDAEMERLGIPHVSVWLETVHAPLAQDVRHKVHKRRLF